MYAEIKQAHYNASYRRHTAKKAKKITRETVRLIIEKIKEKWSPVQISGIYESNNLA